MQDTDFRILKINQAGCDALGREANDIIGRHYYTLFSDQNEPCHLCPVAETANTLKPHAQEMFSKPLGKTFLVSAAPVMDENGTLTHLTHVARDITDKKKLEEDLFQAQKMESIGTLAGGIAHDFNNILSIIMGYAELAKVHIPQDSKAHIDIDQIFESSRRAADLVRQILTFSRKSNHSLEPLSPHLIVKEALKMLRASLPSTIHIQEEIDKNCGNIMADPTNIHQIVINLCTNALHSMENEKGTLSIRLYRETLNKQQIAPELGESPGLFVTLEIKDTGHGMDPHVIANIFDPYFTTKEVGKGTGLGLSVIHGIIKDYHGFIRVDSKPGNGSRFQIYIPALTQEASAKKTSVDNEEALPTGTERILIVDDESSIVAVTQKILERLGYSVTITTESFLALEKIRSAPDKFDLVISDQTMPGMTGVDLSKKILKIRPDMPIIICTGYSSVISEENFFAIGIKKYLKKPISTKRLAMSIRQVIDES